MKKQKEVLDPQVFDHSMDTIQVCKGSINFLSQGGSYFSYAEYDRILKRYVPEPIPINLYGIYNMQTEELLVKILPLLEKLAPLTDSLGLISQKGRDVVTEQKRKYDSLRGTITQYRLKIKDLESQVESLKKEAGKEVENGKTE